MNTQRQPKTNWAQQKNLNISKHLKSQYHKTLKIKDRLCSPLWSHHSMLALLFILVSSWVEEEDDSLIDWLVGSLIDWLDDLLMDWLVVFFGLRKSISWIHYEHINEQFNTWKKKPWKYKCNMIQEFPPQSFFLRKSQICNKVWDKMRPMRFIRVH